MLPQPNEWAAWFPVDQALDALARITLAHVFEWSGCITGVIGAGLLALNNRRSGYGFLFFLLANACWIAFGIMTAAWGLVVMQIFCTGTSLLGIWKWILKGRSLQLLFPRIWRLILKSPLCRSRTAIN